jgi:hypothetical protein
MSSIACAPAALTAQQQGLPQQIADAMVKLNGGVHTGVRFAHAKGMAKASADYMFTGLRARLARGPIRYKLYVQLANPGDPTNDGSIVWPDDPLVILRSAVYALSVQHRH